MLEKLQTFSEEELSQEVYICGADCMINEVCDLSIQNEDYMDQDGYVIPAGAITIDW